MYSLTHQAAMLVGSLLLSRAYNSSISTQCCHVINAMYSMNGKILQFFSLSLRPVAALYLITYLFKHLVLDVVVAALVVSFFLSIKREHIHTCDQSEIIIFMKTTSRYEKRKIHHTFYRLLYMIFTVSCRSSRWNTHKKKRENIIKY